MSHALTLQEFTKIYVEACEELFRENEKWTIISVPQSHKFVTTG